MRLAMFYQILSAVHPNNALTAVFLCFWYLLADEFVAAN